MRSYFFHAHTAKEPDRITTEFSGIIEENDDSLTPSEIMGKIHYALMETAKRKIIFDQFYNIT